METGNYLGLEKLDAWRKSIDFAARVIQQVVPVLPPEEKYGLSQQLRRAAQSIPANIAEGHGRYYFQETIRFCMIARGSLEETVSHLALAHKVGMIDMGLHDSLCVEARELVRLINGYVAYLKRTRVGENEPGAHLSTREGSGMYTLALVEDLSIEDEKYYP